MRQTSCHIVGPPWASIMGRNEKKPSTSQDDSWGMQGPGIMVVVKCRHHGGNWRGGRWRDVLLVNRNMLVNKNMTLKNVCWAKMTAYLLFWPVFISAARFPLLRNM
jgi:hypothetical protein